MLVSISTGEVGTHTYRENAMGARRWPSTSESSVQQIFPNSPQKEQTQQTLSFWISSLSVNKPPQFGVLCSSSSGKIMHLVSMGAACSLFSKMLLPWSLTVMLCMVVPNTVMIAGTYWCCARHFSKSFIWSNLLNPHSNPVRSMLLLVPFYGDYQGTKFNNLS